jgi:excisionase family DNA binding protein
MEREILTLQETADYLRCSRMTIYRLLRQGEIPAFRIGIGRGGWRFMREPLDNWMEIHTVSPLTGRRQRVSTYGPSERP